MKIFLVYLVINSPQSTPYNYGLGYISAVLKLKSNHNIFTFVLKYNNDVNSFFKKVINEKPDIIAFSATTPQVYYLKLILNEIRRLTPLSILG